MIKNAICIHEEDAGKLPSADSGSSPSILFRDTLEAHRFPPWWTLPLCALPKARGFNDLYGGELRIWYDYIYNLLYAISQSNLNVAFYWNFYLDGTVELETRLTGILNV